MQILDGARVETVCEVGCGAGEILRQLHDQMPDVRRLVGYEIADAALAMAATRATNRLSFTLGDASLDPERFDLMLIMDVIEHVPDPIGFLSSLQFKADRTLVHIPLELSAQSVLRPARLLSSRSKSGHIHYFTAETAIATIEDAGYSVNGSLFTRSFDLPRQSLKAEIVGVPRKLLPRAATMRLLGGYSILIDATARKHY